MDSKKFKRLGAVILSALMVFGQSGPVYADDDTGQTEQSASVGNMNDSNTKAVITYSGPGTLNVTYHDQNVSIESKAGGEAKTFTVYGKADDSSSDMFSLKLDTETAVKEFKSVDPDANGQTEDFLQNSSGVKDIEKDITMNVAEKKISVVFEEPAESNNTAAQNTAVKSVKISIKDSSSSTDITDKNANYSLAGRAYKITALDADGNALADTSALVSSTGEALKTDENGNISADVNVPEGTAKIKLTSDNASTLKGYKNPKDEVSQTAEVTSSNTSSFTFKEDPEYTPFNVAITKVDADKRTKAKSLEGTIFKVEYFVQDPASAADAKAERTWYIQTKKNKDDKYQAKLDTSHLAGSFSNNRIYKDGSSSDASVVMPLGTVRISEYSPSTGYTAAGSYVVDKIDGTKSSKASLKSADDGTITLNIADDNGTVKMTSDTTGIKNDEEIVKSDQNVRGKLVISCVDLDNRSNTALSGASFTITYKNEGKTNTVKADTDGDGIGDGKELSDGDAVKTITLTQNDQGKWESNDTFLSAGTYTVKENNAPTGYTDSNEKYKKEGFDITISGNVSANQKQVKNVTFYYRAMRGGFELQTLDSQMNNSHQGDASSLRAEYKLVLESDIPVVVKGVAYNKGDQISDTFWTSDSGEYKSEEDLLPVGTYGVYEVTAPVGYCDTSAVDKKVADFSITKSGDIAKVSSVNEVKRSSFKFNRLDADDMKRTVGDNIGKRTAGDNVDLASKFNVVNKSAFAVTVDKNGSGIIDDDETFKPGAVIYEFSTDAEGNYDSASDKQNPIKLPYGRYAVVEAGGDDSQQAYYKPNEESTEFSVADQDAIEVSKGVSGNVPTVIDEEKKSALKLTKLMSGSVDLAHNEEEGAEFYVVLARYVYALKGDDTSEVTKQDVINAYNQHAAASGLKDAKGDGSYTGYADTEYDDIVTGADGKAETKPLAYGKYFFVEACNRSDSGAKVTDSVFTFNSTGEETKNVNIINDSSLYTIKITKFDKDTGAVVTKSGASYRIKCVDLDDYRLNTLSDENKLKLGIGEDNYVTYVSGEKHYSVFRTNDGTSTKDNGNGVYYADKDKDEAGSVTVLAKVPAGTYELEEVSAPDGFKVGEDAVKFKVDASQPISGSVDGKYNTIAVENHDSVVTGSLHVQKEMDSWGADESKFDTSDLSGFGFTLYAAKDIINLDNGRILVAKGQEAVKLDRATGTYVLVGEVFCSKDGKLNIKNLPVGEYTLKETTSPAGTVTENKEYSVKDVLSGSVLKSASRITKLAAVKLTAGKARLGRASMEIVDAGTDAKADMETGTVVTKFKSSGDKDYTVAGLTAGHYYYLVETKAPEGYVKASSKQFYVDPDYNANKNPQTVAVIDKQVTASAKDASDASQILEGAEFSVYEAPYTETSETIDHWIVKSADKGMHAISNLEAGKKYVIVETNTPDGYVTAENYTFEAADDQKDQTIVLANKKVMISKTGVNGKAVKGAVISVIDKETGDQADSWAVGSKEEAHAVSGLKEGRTYIIHEEKAPEGYAAAADTVFTAEGADEHGRRSDQSFTVIDKRVSACLADTEGNAVIGAKLAVKNSSGDVVDAWITDGNAHYINGLEEGTGYVLSEEVAPGGYIKAVNISFKVSGADDKDRKEDQTVSMTEKYVSLDKVNSSGSKVVGASVKVEDEEGNTVDQWNTGVQITAFTDTQISAMKDGKTVKVNADGSDKAEAYAVKNAGGGHSFIVRSEDKDGIASYHEVDEAGYETAHRISGLEEGKKYVIEEVKAPKDYVKASDSAFTVSGADENGVKEDQHFKVTDKQISAVKTDADGKALAGAQLTVYEADKDGTVNKDQAVDQWITSEAKHYISGLEAGKKYVIVETIVPKEYVKMTDRNFTAEDNGKDQDIKLTDKQLTVKIADTYGNELAGADLELTDKETGAVVDSWKSDAKAHTVTGAAAGKTYVLTEKTAPAGYVKQGAIEIKVDDDGKNQTAVLTDTADKLRKADSDGKIVKGAELEAVDGSGKAVDSWTSGEHLVDLSAEEQKSLKDGKSVVKDTADGHKITVYPVVDKDEKKVSVHYVMQTVAANGSAKYSEIDENGDETFHMISGLEAGGKYTVKETKVPAGYYYADDVAVEASGSGDTAYDMADTQVKYVIRKMDDKNNPVVGVTLKLTDITNADSPKEVELPNKGVTVEKPFELNGVLEADHKYKLEETNIVNSYYAAQAMEFAVGHKASDDKPVTITMIDSTTSVTVLSVDSDMKPVKGVKMQLIEAEPVSGSDKAEAVDVEAYKAEHADEFKAFVDAYKADHADVSDEDAQKAVEDEIAAGMILSIDENGHLQTAVDAGTDAGSEDTDADYIAVKNEDGTDKVVHEFETTDNVDGTDISAYVEGGKSYILREVEAPFGYRKAAEQGFTVTGELNLAQVITFTNQRQVVYVGVKAVDAKSGKALKGAEFALLNKGSKVVLDAAGKPAVKSTDVNGYALFAVTYRDGMENGGYYIRETKSPDGYKINMDSFEIKLGKDYSFSETDPLMITVKDESRKAVIGRNGSLKTNAGIGIGVGIAAGIAGAVLIILLIVKGKKKDEDSEG